MIVRKSKQIFFSIIIFLVLLSSCEQMADNDQKEKDFSFEPQTQIGRLALIQKKIYGKKTFIIS